MSLKIYGIAASRAFRNIWMARELGIPYEHVQVGFDAAGAGSPEFRKINPNGRVPTIDDDGFRLFESLAINLYLAKKHGKLYPAGLEDEARAWQWSFWAMGEVDQTIVTWAMNTVAGVPEKRDPAKAAAALETLQRPFRVLEETLAGRDYILGSAFTVADLNVASVMFRARAMDLGAYPNIKNWLDRCYARPGAAEAVALRA